MSPFERVEVGRLFGLDEADQLEVLREQEGVPTVIRTPKGIYKRARHFDPRDGRPIPKTAWALFNEWAALEFLDGIVVEPQVSPRLLQADENVGVLLVEDLDEAPSLIELLRGDDAVTALEGCVGYAQALARMHKATVGRAQQYEAIRDALGPDGRYSLYQNYTGQLRGFRKVCAGLGIPLKNAEVALNQILATLEAPADTFYGLCHGDIGPGNQKILADRAMLIDFEVAGFGHVLLELVGARLGFLEGDNTAVLPEEVVTAMEGAYWTELGLNADEWSKEYVMCSAFHALAGMTIAIENQRVDWRAAYQCEALLWLLEEKGLLQELCEPIRVLGQSLPKSMPVVYDAFR